ncbi:hypothetical protein FKZ61_001635 [Litorilinea aerophila]|uniref:hypothetical protein n=1 Tax=Litorilinea aerophila TaxID=1204385 RepID=UPI001B8763C8|nr:hypothetical protein [Litorilinea aerophila]MCC9074819.1 hypothetical protein [Litorilinea aerophila]GIV77857.1 MAG: hypothetical protein KatS3mg050_2251 [Litorilinea sp.]
MATARCIECDEEIELGTRVRLGLQVTCENCGAELEVVSVNPLELDWAYEEDEEWDEDEDEEYDDDDDFDDDDYDDDDYDDDDDDYDDDDLDEGRWN